MSIKQLWCEKYRPKNLEQYVFQNEQHRQQILRIVASGEIPHLMLTGTQGSGKTTLAEILITELDVEDVDVLRINASDKTGIDYIRDTILSFASTYPMGKFKVIHLAEFDYMSLAAQGMLRAVMEENSDTCRFICTCNYENKIIPAIKSRMQHMRFKAPSKDDILARMFEILIAEEVDFGDGEVVLKYVDQAYPDLRKIINNMQLNTLMGTLGNPVHDSEGGDYQFKLLDLIAAGNLRELRKLVTEQCTSEQITEVFEFLYKNLNKHPKYAANINAYEQGLCILAEGLYKHGLVAIPHLNFEATCIRLNNAIGE